MIFSSVKLPTESSRTIPDDLANFCTSNFNLMTAIREEVKERNQISGKLFPTIENSLQAETPHTLEIPMVMLQFSTITWFTISYLFVGKLVKERVGAVERVGEATSEEQVKKWSQQANERAEEWEDELGDEQVAYF